MARKSLILMTLLGLGGCSLTPCPALPTKPDCVIPPWPVPPHVSTTECTPNFVCLTIPDTVALAEWIAQMRRIQAVLETCSNVVPTPFPVSGSDSTNSSAGSDSGRRG